MPDISMCPSPDCPLRRDCYRNEASGTRPTEWRQSWIGFTWRSVADGDAVLCDGYWPARDTSPASSQSHPTPDPPSAGA